MAQADEFTIVSGGQTGADRAALDYAIQHGIPHGGWCPRGRLAEDGPLAEIYRLRETPSRQYAERTRWNVRDSDATLVFTLSAETSGGTALTIELAQRQGKPCLHIAQELTPDVADAAEQLRTFLTYASSGSHIEHCRAPCLTRAGDWQVCPPCARRRHTVLCHACWL